MRGEKILARSLEILCWVERLPLRNGFYLGLTIRLAFDAGLINRFDQPGNKARDKGEAIISDQVCQAISNIAHPCKMSPSYS
jgi:hypothetical protein